MKLQFRFSMRSLLVAMTIICVLLCSPIATVRYRVTRQTRAMRELRVIQVEAKYGADIAPSWFTHQTRHWIHPLAFRKAGDVVFPDSLKADVDKAVAWVLLLDQPNHFWNYSPHFGDTQLTNLAGSRAWEELDLLAGTYTVKGLMPHLGNHHLRRIHAPNVKWEDDMLRRVGRLTNLESIQIDAPDATAKGLSALSGCKALTRITAVRLKAPGQLASALQEISTLEKLTIRNSHLSKEDAAAIAALAQIRCLEIVDCKIGQGGIAELAKLGSLQILNLSGSQIAPTDLVALPQMGGVSQLTLPEGISDDNAELFLGMTRVTRLELPKTSLTDKGLKTLATLPKLNTIVLPADTKCTIETFREIQAQKPFSVIVGEGDKSIRYLPDGEIQDLEKIATQPRPIPKRRTKPPTIP